MHSLGEVRGRRQLTVALVLLALASSLAWALAARRQLQGSQAMPPALWATAPAALAPPSLLSAADLARLLGQPGALADEPETGPRFVLLGVVAGASGSGVALVAVDGAPARPFGVGAELAPGFVLQRLAARSVVLAASLQGTVTRTLELPAWAPLSAASGAQGTEQAMEPSRAPADALPPTGQPPDGSSAQPGRRGDQGAP